MNPWPNLVKIALLGTRRGQIAADPQGSPLDQFWSRLPVDAPEHQLLSAAGSAYLYEQVGSAPSRSNPEPPQPPPPRDPRPPGNAQAAHLLSRMLGEQRSHLPEFLQALLDKGVRLPPILVPNVLAMGISTPTLRPLIIPLLSPSDRQLAAAHPDWLYASQAVENWKGAHELWNGLSLVGKTRLLQQQRITQPALARQLLESTWKAEQDQARINFIKQLDNGLSFDDEPFLEMALDDRNQVVRRRAAELLAYIPGSRLSRRLCSYSAQYLTWREPDQIIIHFPTLSPQMVRDGIYSMKHKNPAQVRSKELIQLIGAVPLSYWTESWHEDPAEIVRAALATNWKRTLTTGFGDASFRQNNRQWARAVLWGRGPEQIIPRLVDILDLSDYCAWLDHLENSGYGEGDLNYSGPLFKSISARQDLGDLPAAMKVLSIISRFMRQDLSTGKANLGAKRVFTSCAYRFPITIYSDVEAVFSDAGSFPAIWQPTVEIIISIMRFRHEMQKVVASQGTVDGESN